MSNQDRIAAFSDHSGDIRQDELTQYRPISPLAVIALLVGLVSGLAIFHNLLWLVPVIGIVLSAVALKHTAPPDAIVSGRTAAIIGLAFSVLFGAMAVTTTFVEKRIVDKHAVEFASNWMNIARSGNLPQAAEWMRAPGVRLPYESDYTKFYESNEDAQTLLTNLSSGKAMKHVLALDEDNRITFDGIDEFTRVDGAFLYDLRFTLPGKSEKEATDVICSVRRTIERYKTRWSVAKFSLAE